MQCCYLVSIMPKTFTKQLPDNIVVNYIPNTMAFAYRFIMGQNVRHILCPNIT